MQYGDAMFLPSTYSKMFLTAADLLLQLSLGSSHGHSGLNNTGGTSDDLLNWFIYDVFELWYLGTLIATIGYFQAQVCFQIWETLDELQIQLVVLWVGAILQGVQALRGLETSLASRLG